VERDLPTGTVTFFFSDVEGSTKLLHELGAEGYGETLAEHRRVLRDAFAAHGGVEVDTQGDAFFVVFPKAPEAVAAAYAAQEALASAFLALTGSARHSAFAHAGVSLARSSDRPHGSGVDVLDLSLLRSTALLEHCFKVCSRPVEPLLDSLPGGRMCTSSTVQLTFSAPLSPSAGQEVTGIVPSTASPGVRRE